MERTRILKSCLFISAALLAVSCARGYQTDLWEIHAKSHYYDVARAHTRDAKNYIDLNQGYLLYATLLTPRFRTSYVNEYASKYKLRPDKRISMMEEQRAEASKGLDWVVAINGYDRSWEKLDPKEGLWKICCSINGGERYSPSTIKKIKKTPKLIYFYPYVNYWTEVYRIHCDFPEGISGWKDIKKVKLEFSGVLGNTEFSWNINER